MLRNGMADMDHTESEGGKAAVRAILIDRLDAAGMVRPKNRTVEQHRDWTQRIVDRLAYMAPENLHVLADALLAKGEGPLRREWPAEATVIAFAEGLQARPWQEAAIVSSWFRSIEGPRALAGGFEVELLGWLRRCPRPPLAFEVAKLREAAADNRRREERVRERIAGQVESEDDRRWLEARLRDRAHARQLIDAGERGRQEKGAA